MQKLVFENAQNQCQVYGYDRDKKLEFLKLLETVVITLVLRYYGNKQRGLQNGSVQRIGYRSYPPLRFTHVDEYRLFLSFRRISFYDVDSRYLSNSVVFLQTDPRQIGTRNDSARS